MTLSSYFLFVLNMSSDQLKMTRMHKNAYLIAKCKRQIIQAYKKTMVTDDNDQYTVFCLWLHAFKFVSFAIQ